MHVDKNNFNLLSSALTALFAVIVYVTGQIIDKLFIAPIQDQKKVIGEISFALTYYGNRFPFVDKDGNIANIKDLEEASDQVRKLASNLRATSYKIPLYVLITKLGFVTSESQIEEASTGLIGWHNSFYEKGGQSRQLFRKKIAENLGIRWY